MSSANKIGVFISSAIEFMEYSIISARTMLNKAVSGVAEFISTAIEFMEWSTIKENGFENVMHSTPIFNRPAPIETPNISQILSDHQRLQCDMIDVIGRLYRLQIDRNRFRKVKHSTPEPRWIESPNVSPNVSQILSDHQREMYAVIERLCQIHID